MEAKMQPEGNDGWTIVIPIRDPQTGKTRLRAGSAVNAAIAHDTLTATLACDAVARVVLVTDQPDWISTQLLSDPRLHLVPQYSRGLTAAIELGLECAAATPTAVMLGDLPSLSPAELAGALVSATTVPRGMVTDHCGTGTTLITAQRAGDHRPNFGPDSAALHRGLGYAELPVPTGSGLRRDIDTPADLDHAMRHGTGSATRQAVARAAAIAS